LIEHQVWTFVLESLAHINICDPLAGQVIEEEPLELSIAVIERCFATSSYDFLGTRSDKRYVVACKHGSATVTNDRLEYKFEIGEAGAKSIVLRAIRDEVRKSNL
jgi:hypothetical protein